MGLNSTFAIFPNSTVHWANNHATYGGAIYILDASPLSYCDGTRVNTLLGPSIAAYIPREECFFQLPGQNMSNVQLVFNNN